MERIDDYDVVENVETEVLVPKTDDDNGDSGLTTQKAVAAVAAAGAVAGGILLVRNIKKNGGVKNWYHTKICKQQEMNINGIPVWVKVKGDVAIPTEKKEEEAK